jgi:hypothetical protein
MAKGTRKAKKIVKGKTARAKTAKPTRRTTKGGLEMTFSSGIVNKLEPIAKEKGFRNVKSYLLDNIKSLAG